MSKLRNREQQHLLKQTLYARRETPELHAMRELLLLRSEEIKRKLVDVSLDQLHKTQGEYRALFDLLQVFNRAPLTDPSAE